MLFGTCNAYDFFTLSLVWSGTSCSSVKNAVPPTPVADGFWPENNDGTRPSCCNGHKYDQKAIIGLSKDLNTYWPSYSCSSSSACGSVVESNLAYEVHTILYETYGRCAMRNDPYNYKTAQLTYFMAAVSRLVQYNITEILLNAGYVPSDTVEYPLEGITSAIKNVLGVTPIVKCNEDSPIKEIQICFISTSLELKECPTYAPSECPSRVKLPIKNVTQGKFSSCIL
nr:ribonuclease 2-like [Ipomoea batatas]